MPLTTPAPIFFRADRATNAADTASINLYRTLHPSGMLCILRFSFQSGD